MRWVLSWRWRLCAVVDIETMREKEVHVAVGGPFIDDGLCLPCFRSWVVPHSVVDRPCMLYDDTSDVPRSFRSN